MRKPLDLDDELALSTDPELVQLSKNTLIRLANSCRRLAGRGTAVGPIGQELTGKDLELIATILSNLAGPADEAE